MNAQQLQSAIRLVISESLQSGEINLGEAISILESTKLDYYLAARDQVLAKKSPIIKPRLDGGRHGG